MIGAATPLAGDASQDPKGSHRDHRDRLYGRRKGRKLRAGQQDRVDRILPSLSIPAPAEGTRLDPRTLFARKVDAVWLEIGFGGGEHLAAQATEHPNIGVIGCEVFETGIATLLREVEMRALDNVRIWPEDARRLLAHLPDASLARIFLLFPDPWPKTRHHKRRFLQMEMLDQLARVLKPGAELRFATDDKSYLPYALERLMAHPAFDWMAGGPSDWKTRPSDWPATRYETKAIKGPPTFLRFQRGARVTQ